MGVAGVFFGVLVGWIVGSQQPGGRSFAPTAAQAPAAGGQAADSSSAPPPPLDEARASAMKTTAQQNPNDAVTRVQLGNLYFDAERYDDAIKWYTDALKLTPNDVNVSTDLGVCYYYVNQPDKALEQFDASLKLDPKHAKTLLNLGIVRAFGKQDLQGAADAWQQVIKVAPDTPEAQAAKRALDSLQSAHPGMSGGTKPSGQ